MAYVALLIGERYGRYVVLGEGIAKPIIGSKYMRYTSKCVCDCGAVKEVSNASLRAGTTRSCGCLHRDRVKAQAKHGHNSRLVPRTTEYNSWATMIARVSNPNNPRWEHYGGRGIKVCEGWKDFSLFLEDMGLKPGKGYSIDRIDNDGHYEPGNCRWATIEQQLENRKSMRRFTFYGMSKTIREWSLICGNSRKTISSRLENGWPPKLAIWANKGTRLKDVLKYA